jgi:hypothetical protein
MRRTASTSPRHAPCFSSASMAYMEHEGEYRQTDGSSGPRKTWYPRTSAIRTERTPTPVSTRQPTERTVHLGTKVGEACAVGGWSGPDDHVQPTLGSKHILPDDFAEATFQPIAIHRRLPMARNDDAYPWKAERGSARPDGEVPGPYDFPLLLNTPDVCAATDALRPRIPQARLTRRRTWTEAARSGASDPFCDAG